jgi:transposase
MSNESKCRVRRTFTSEFKREAVELIRKQGLSVVEAARRLDVHANLLRKWQSQAAEQGAQAFPGKGHQTALEEENRRLRDENARLRMEREILKKATAFFAKESK